MNHIYLHGRLCTHSGSPFTHLNKLRVFKIFIITIKIMSSTIQHYHGTCIYTWGIYVSRTKTRDKIATISYGCKKDTMESVET